MNFPQETHKYAFFCVACGDVDFFFRKMKSPSKPLPASIHVPANPTTLWNCTDTLLHPPNPPDSKSNEFRKMRARNQTRLRIIPFRFPAFPSRIPVPTCSRPQEKKDKPTDNEEHLLPATS